MWRAEPILLSVLPNQKWQMRIESLARRRPTRSSWGRRSRNKMFWQLSRGRGRALSFQLRISNGDPSSILISGTLWLWGSRNPALINRWESRQITDWFFPRLYITGLRAHDVRPVRRVLRFGHWGFTLSSDVADWSRFSGCCNHHDFRGFSLANDPRSLRGYWLEFWGGGLDNLCICVFWRSL